MRIVFGIAVGVMLSLSACGSSGGGGGGEEGPTAESGELDTTSNPISSTQFFGQNGNLWKPHGEEGASGSGRPVILLSSQFTKRFDTCEVVLHDGSTVQLDCNDRVPWSHEPYSCFANGNRQHWRCPCNCGDIAQARVVCRDANQEVTFEVPGAGITQTCDRHG